MLAIRDSKATTAILDLLLPILDPGTGTQEAPPVRTAVPNSAIVHRCADCGSGYGGTTCRNCPTQDREHPFYPQHAAPTEPNKEST